MSKEYLPDQEKRILLSALGHEMSLVKENNLTELIPVVRSLDYKFMYDRLFKQIEKNAYEQGMKEHNVFVSNIPIEDIVLNAVNDERERIVAELSKNGMETVSGLDVVEMQRAIDIVRGDVNENEI
jgi:hypothetical protein